MPNTLTATTRPPIVRPRRDGSARLSPPAFIGAGRGLSSSSLIAPITSYSNAGGSGNRTGAGDNTIAVTSNITWDQGTTPNIIDGSTASNAGNAVDEPGVSGVSVAGSYIDFYFQDLKKYADEITIVKSNTSSNGNWQLLVTNDGANYSVAADYTWSGSSFTTALVMPYGGAKVFRLLGISGTWTNSWFQEVTFKIAPGAV